jgi:hypothetical protein
VRILEKEGLLIPDPEQPWLDLDFHDPMDTASAASTEALDRRYRIAIGPHSGNRTLTLHDPLFIRTGKPAKALTADRDGFSLNAAVSCQPYQRDRLVHLMGLDNNILTQVGLIVLVGLASKNAILIVEFARHRESEGAGLYEAASDAANLRLRPILMTSFAFILGVLPLVAATGAGAEMRQALGVAVFSGMLGVTFFGLIFTPVFYVLMRKLAMQVNGQKLD